VAKRVKFDSIPSLVYAGGQFGFPAHSARQADEAL